MSQRGQLMRLKRTGHNGGPLWAYRYRTGGRDSRRVQRGGFVSEHDAAEALERELERLRRERRVSRSLTVAELVDAYLAQHDVEPVTIEKLRWLLGKAVAAFGGRPVWGAPLGGDRRLADRPLARLPLRRHAGGPPGARTGGGLGHDRRQAGEAGWTTLAARREQRPFGAELDAVATHLSPRYRPMVIFAAATVLRPAESLAFEWRDVDLEAW